MTAVDGRGFEGPAGSSLGVGLGTENRQRSFSGNRLRGNVGPVAKCAIALGVLAAAWQLAIAPIADAAGQAMEDVAKLVDAGDRIVVGDCSTGSVALQAYVSPSTKVSCSPVEAYVNASTANQSPIRISTSR